MSDNLRFVYSPPEDDSVDGEYQLYDGNVLTNIGIQDCYRYTDHYAVNEYFPSRDQLEYVEHHGQPKSLELAKELAISVYQKGKSS